MLAVFSDSSRAGGGGGMGKGGGLQQRGDNSRCCGRWYLPWLLLLPFFTGRTVPVRLRSWAGTSSQSSHLSTRALLYVHIVQTHLNLMIQFQQGALYRQEHWGTERLRTCPRSHSQPVNKLMSHLASSGSTATFLGWEKDADPYHKSHQKQRKGEGK